VPASNGPSFPTGFIVLLIIVAIIMVVGLIVAVGGGIRRASILRSGGLSPFYA
jgi:hypothetical protein